MCMCEPKQHTDIDHALPRMTRLGLIEHPCPPPSPPLCEEAVSKVQVLYLRVRSALSGADLACGAFRPLQSLMRR